MTGRFDTLSAPNFGASGLKAGLRAFFCACLLLLPLYGAAERPEPRGAGVGMEASPPPLLEASTRLAPGGGLERRSGLPAAPGSWRTVVRVWNHTPKAAPVPPDPARAPRAAFGRWQLEGG